MTMRNALIAAAALAATTAALAGRPNGFINLGADVESSAVSADGSVITGLFNGQYFVWTQSTGIVSIGGADPTPYGGQPSISHDGRYIGGTLLDPSDNLGQMGRYDRTTGQWTLLGNLGGSSGNSTSSGWGISGNGQSVVGLGWLNAGGAHAVQWNEGGSMTDLGSTVDGRSTRANAANFDGSVVGGWQDAESGFRQGAIWRNGVQTLITNDAGERIGEVQALSDDGNWAVGSGVSVNGWEAWRWSEATGLQNLGHLSPTFRGAATDVSADGSVVVGYDRPFGPALFGQGFIWTEDLGMMNLNAYAESLGIDTQGVVMSLPLGISADGRTIVGMGRGATPGAVGWSLTIPTPATGALLGLGGLAAIRRRR